ncbi:hypothetical protein EUGRSUZ_E02669 [Eucalyptus grandis]|uniref:Uncharacterized protein n=2 Tax=Eucalyptus grandis TaxID=71139 RepID=A0ACC3KYH4_EUCGR|nr:hypothetical protein EUGRSUZ_E02669 [Eucalyptus grandis]
MKTTTSMMLRRHWASLDIVAGDARSSEDKAAHGRWARWRRGPSIVELAVNNPTEKLQRETARGRERRWSSFGRMLLQTDAASLGFCRRGVEARVNEAKAGRDFGGVLTE